MVVILGFVTIGIATPVQWKIADGGNDHWYEAIQISAGITWEDAKNAAVNAGGHLATITSSTENAFVFDLINDFDKYWYTSDLAASLGPWIGGFQPQGSSEPAGGWEWVTGEAFSYSNWATGEPNNSPSSGLSEDSLHYFSQSTNSTSDRWNDPARHSRNQIGIIHRFHRLHGLLATDPRRQTQTLFADYSDS